jgi:hypothetical protein
MSEEKEPVVNFCNWVTYKGIRCTAKLKEKEIHFCSRHVNSKKDFKFIDAIDIDKLDLNCITNKEIMLFPRSKEYIHQTMSSLKYEYTEEVEVVFHGKDHIPELGDICEDFIKLKCDNTEFYFNPKRGQKKAKDLRIKLVDNCSGIPFISVRDDCYCRDCYAIIAKKLNYPTVKTLELN